MASLSRSCSRSASPGRHRSSKSRAHRHSRPKDSSRERTDKNLPSGVDPIGEDDYFLKSAEFGRWLHEEKGRYFDELTADKARSYFRRFVKAWNRGRLRDEHYTPLSSASVPSSTRTAYKWTFASNRSRVNAEELRRVRESVDGDTYGSSSAGPNPLKSSVSSGSGRLQGPTLPSPSDLQLAREDAASYASMEKLAQRKHERMEDKERIEDMVGPKEMGREGMLEKKRMKREGDKAFRDAKDDGGLDVADSVLMGGGGSFKEMISKRDAARARFEAKKWEQQHSKVDERRERAEQIKERDRQTMDMFKKLAKERFG